MRFVCDVVVDHPVVSRVRVGLFDSAVENEGGGGRIDVCDLIGCARNWSHCCVQVCVHNNH